MATTNSDVVKDALGLIGVLNEIQEPSAEQGAHALRRLNDLMAHWLADGIDLQYYEQTSLTEDTPIPAHARPAVRYALGFLLAPDYGRQVTPEMLSAGDAFYSRLLRESVYESLTESDLSKLPAGYNNRGSRILTG